MAEHVILTFQNIKNHSLFKKKIRLNHMSRKVKFKKERNFLHIQIKSHDENSPYVLKIGENVVRKMAQQLSACCLSRGPESGSQNPYWVLFL